MNYYNEFDPFAAQWLKELIKAGHISNGVVDTRSITEVLPGDLSGYKQCHFFAGIGVWSYALRGAGWPDDKPIWTGSCPCQPFSAAGKRKGKEDERHLWPAWFRLIAECRPVTIFGEQVASKDALSWIDLVQTDLESSDYTTGAVDICSAGFGAPHIRQRLYWLAHAAWATRVGTERCGDEGFDSRGIGEAGGMAEPEGGRQRTDGYEVQRQDRGRGGDIGMGDPNNAGLEGRGLSGSECSSERTAWSPSSLGGPGPTNGFWRDVDWLFCRDSKWRPVEPGASPLASGAPARVGRLRGFGNAITAETAKEFIQATVKTIGG